MKGWQPIMWNWREAFLGTKFLKLTPLYAVAFPLGVIMPGYYAHAYLSGKISIH
jgi:hypothetical protein